MKTHHLEYAEGGILDMDDMLNDLVEDRDKVRTEQEQFGPKVKWRSVFFLPSSCCFHTYNTSLTDWADDANGNYEAEKNTAEPVMFRILLGIYFCGRRKDW